MKVQLWFCFGRFGGKNHLKGRIVGNLFVHWAKDTKQSKQDWDQGKKFKYFQGKIDDP